MTVVSRLVRAGAVLPRPRWWSPGWPRPLFGPRLEQSARKTVAARAAFATALVSSLSAARTVKLAGATGPVLAHLARLDRGPQRAAASRDRHPGAGPVHAVAGQRPAADRRVGALPHRRASRPGRRWSRCRRSAPPAGSPGPPRRWSRSCPRPGCGPDRTVGDGRRRRTTRPRCRASTSRPAPRRHPSTAPRNPLRRSTLAAVHRRARGRHGRRARHRPDRRPRTAGARGRAGRLGQVVAAAGAGRHRPPHRRAALERRTGRPSRRCSCGPTRSATSASCRGCSPARSPTTSELGHEVDAAAAVSTAQLDHDLAAAGGGLGLLIGHKGTRLSGGQLQRLALARALARAPSC